MKVFSVVFFFSIMSFAGTIEVVGPCSSEPLFKSQTSLPVGENLGNFTVETLEQNNIPFIGNAKGIHSIYDTPTGEEALEVLSRSEMRTYGWCFEVDGLQPEVYADKIIIDSKDSHVVWFFGFAHYLKGQWVSQCEKSYELKPAFLCN